MILACKHFFVKISLEQAKEISLESHSRIPHFFPALDNNVKHFETFTTWKALYKCPWIHTQSKQYLIQISISQWGSKKWHSCNNQREFGWYKLSNLWSGTKKVQQVMRLHSHNARTNWWERTVLPWETRVTWNKTVSTEWSCDNYDITGLFKWGSRVEISIKIYIVFSQLLRAR